MTGLSSARRSAVLSDLKLLVDYRDQLVRARTQMANRAHADLVVIRPGYEEKVPNLRARRHVVRARTLLRGDRSVRGELLRLRLAEVLRLSRDIEQTDRRIAAKLRETSTTLTEIPGVGPLVAAKILGEVGDLSRLRSKAAFALLTGTAPLVASSGQTHRHRLNRGGNRQLNWSLHCIALVQSRTVPEAKLYLARQRETGKSYKEAMRCLKRHLPTLSTAASRLMPPCSGARLDNIERQVGGPISRVRDKTLQRLSPSSPVCDARWTTTESELMADMTAANGPV
jgi:transposase